MPVQFVIGDPLATTAQVLAFGHNARGRTELGVFETRLMQTHPPAFAMYQKQCRAGQIKAGDLWLWRENTPQLMFMAVRDSSVGATRLRYVQANAIRIAREYPLLGIKSLAIAPLGNPYEWAEIRQILAMWLDKTKLDVTIYEL
ncbi:MAG TPA: hypothetical protein PLZ51_25080 [Aggregatilineales bacterium]|nr:hypothetical protein [Aggregatilineales bacterium]